MGAEVESAGAAQKQSRLERAGEWLKEHWDAGTAIAAGIAVGLLSAFEITSVELTGGVTLAVLAVVAGAILRDRKARAALLEHLQSEETGIEKVAKAVGDRAGELSGRMNELERALAALDSPFPYEVLAQHTTVNLTPTGDATIRSRRHVRFLREARTVEMEWGGDGGSGGFRMWVESDAGAEIEFTSVGTIESAGGGIDVMSLGRRYVRGELLEFWTERIRTGVYPTHDEAAEIMADAKSQNSEFQFVWPKERPPASVRLKRAGSVDDLTAQLGTDASGCPTLRYAFSQLQIREHVTIYWKW